MGGNTEDFEYNPLNKNKLKELGFDYIALGHIHKLNYNEEENQRIVYPGSCISLGFDELGEHGVILGDLTKESINLKFLRMDLKEFKEEFLNVTDIYSIEELIEKINNMKIYDNIFYKIVLIGNRNFEININKLYQFIEISNIIKIKDNTKINIDIEKLSNEMNLKGLFIKEILNDKNLKNIDEKTAEKIIEIGLEILK